MLDPSLPSELGLHKTRHEIVPDLTVLTERCRRGIHSRVPRFTKAVLRALVPTDPALVAPEKRRNQVLVWSAALPCACFVVEPSGHVGGAVQHRVLGSRKSIADMRISTIDQFEARARAILAAAKAGRNLLAEEKEAARRKKAEITVGEMINKYLAVREIQRERAYHRKVWCLQTMWKPLHGFSGERIERSDILPVLLDIVEQRGPGMGQNAKGCLGAAFKHALKNGWLERQYLPTANLPMWKAVKRTRWLRLDEQVQLWRAVEKIDSELGDMVHLLQLTGCRQKEIGNLAPREFEAKERQLRIPGHRTKNGLGLIVPLAPAAMAILLRREPHSAERVFRSISWSDMKRTLDQKLGFEIPWRWHDLRRSFVSGVREHLRERDTQLIELCVNHVSGARGGVAGHYDSSERIDDRRKLYQRWAKLLLGAVGEPVESAKVVKLR